MYENFRILSCIYACTQLNLQNVKENPSEKVNSLGNYKPSKVYTHVLLISYWLQSIISLCMTVGSGIKIMLNIKSLEELEGRGGRKVRIIESIGSEWEEVAKALDMEQEEIDMIKTRHLDHDEEACYEILATWLEGNNGEVSWTALTQAFIDAGLPQLADSLRDVLTFESVKCEDEFPMTIDNSEPLQAKQGT